MYQHLRYNCGTFYNAAVRCKVSFQYGKSACLCIRIVDWADNLRIQIYTVFDILAHCFSSYCHALCMEKSQLVQLIHNCIDTAGLIKIFHVSRASRCKVAEIRSLLTDLICKADIKVHSDLMCNGRKMKHAVCGTTKCHIYSKGIQNCLFCHDISWADVPSVHFHYLHSCMLCKTDTLGIYGRDGTVSFQAHSENLCQAVHTVCSVHTGT